MDMASPIIPNEILYNFSKIYPTRVYVKKRRFPRLRAFFARKTTKVAALVCYWGAETAALLSLAISAPSLGVLAAFAVLYIYASYVFGVAISTIVRSQSV